TLTADRQFHTIDRGMGRSWSLAWSGMACQIHLVIYIDYQSNGLVARHGPQNTLVRRSHHTRPAPPRANHLRHGDAPSPGHGRLRRHPEEWPVSHRRHGISIEGHAAGKSGQGPARLQTGRRPACRHPGHARLPAACRGRTDRRKLTVTLTDRGHGAAAVQTEARKKIDAELLARVRPADVDITRRTLAALVEIGRHREADDA